MVWSEHIIMADWVSCINEMPFPPLTVDLQPEIRVYMYGNIPESCRHNDLLLTSPHCWVECLGDICGEGKDWVLRPELGP